MEKYTYLVYRRALAIELMKRKQEWTFIDDISDWTIYKEEEKYHLIRFALKTQDGYKFPFIKELFSDKNIISIFSSLFKPTHEQEEDEQKCKYSVCDNINFVFHLATTDNKFSEFKVYSISNDDKEFKDLPKIQACLGKINGYFRLLEINHEMKLGLRNNPTSYENIIMENPITIEIEDEILKKTKEQLKNDEQYKIDYNRILDRSFIYFIEYGNIEELKEIIGFSNNKFEELKKHLERNQEIINNKSELIKKYNDFSKEYSEIYKFKDEFKSYFRKKIDIETFKKEFFTDKERKCAYCGVNENQLSLLSTVRAGRGERLEYDRIISREGNNKIKYDLKNIVLSCYWCNNAKTDTFSPKEFKPIAKGINQVWNEKLKEKGSSESICFPENSKIWEKVNKEEN